MTRYIIRRLLFLFLVLFGVATFVFLLTFIVPSDPALAVAGERANTETIMSIRKAMGLDQPIYVQYFRHMIKVVQLDLGHSYIRNTPVTELILNRFPATLQLALAGVLMSTSIGLTLGILAALHAGSPLDRIFTLMLVLGLSSPGFWTGLLLLYFLAFLIPIFPLGGYGQPIQIVLPALTLGLVGAAWYGRMIRSSMLEILSSDYIRTARAKGLPYWHVVFRHAVRNAIGPAITMIGLDLGAYLGGVIAIEQVFAWPGVGSQAFTAMTDLDRPLIVGTVLFGSFFIASLSLVVDVAYGLVDPRIKYS
ncbi:MAG: ABC transporter permease [Chloroflexi bacterium]|nr:ABC transporter permease [Chloroflexota bacterium]